MANTPLASLKFPGLPDTYTIPKNDELVNEGVKTALLQLAQKVAYIDEHGQDYYDDLYNALYPAVGVNNIIAVFNSGGVTIYNTNTLDDLRQYLTVTAIMTDSSTEVVTTYTLSGSMDAGTQTITVSYGGKTTTFSVTVVEWLVSISAVFTQGSAVIFDTDSLDTLKQYLTVTATYADSSTATVTDYTLSGTLTEGTSTITVDYGGKTDTFNVTVSMGLPTGYTKYDYIRPITESNGKIRNTNIIFLPLTGDKQQMKYHFSYKVAGALDNVRGMLGGRNVSGVTEALGFYAPVEDTFFRIMACGATDLDFFTLTSGIVHDVTYIGGDSPTVSVDGNGPANVPVQSVPVVTASLGLFGNQVNGTGDTYSNNNLQVGRIRIYSLADVLLADYVPCVQQSTGYVGVYDKVSNQFIGKASTRYAAGNWS